MQHFISFHFMTFMYKTEMKFLLAITLLFFSFVLSKEVSVPQWEDLECEVICILFLLFGFLHTLL